MNFAAAYGLLAHALIFGAFAALLPLGELRPRVALAATTVALIAGIAPVMHGIFGLPSLTLLQLALLQLTGRTPSPLTYPPALGLLFFLALFYPAALGWSAFDPYALGYQPWAILAALLPVAGTLAWRRRNIWLSILAVDLAGYAAGLFVNLWDALFDPLLALVALTVVGRRVVFALIAARRR
jgi:hypothetical protein